MLRTLSGHCAAGLYAALVILQTSCRGAPPDGASSKDPDEDAFSHPTSLTGTAPRAYGGFPSVVMLFPEEPGELPREVEPALMDQYGNEFHPQMLIVRPGQAVEFRNSEDVVHNVHVIDVETRKTVFNVATPVVGAYTHTFESPGALDVSCNIHNWMGAFIIVTEAPYVAIADRDGGFSMPAVPPGLYEARVWNLDETRRLEREIRIERAPAELLLFE